MRAFLLTLPVFGFLLAFCCAWLVGQDTIRADIDACANRDCFDRESAAQLKDTITPFIRGSKYEGKLNTDGAPRDGFLNVYVTRSKPEGRLASIKCNCAYVGSSTIVCDKDFLNTFSNTVNFTRGAIYGKDAGAIWEQEKSVFDRLNGRIADVLKSWLIGHEVGHAILHSDHNFGRRKAFTQQQEREADSFFIERSLVGADKQRVQDLSFGLTQIIFAVVGIAMNTTPAEQGAPSKAVIAPSLDGIHPPWLIRALQLGQEISVLRQTGPKPDDFYANLASNVVEQKNGIDVGTLCASENLREIEARLQEKRLRPGD